MVYVLIREEGNVKVFSEKTALAKELGVSYRTVLRNLRDEDWIKKDFSVFQRELLPKKSARGGWKRGFRR